MRGVEGICYSKTEYALKNADISAGLQNAINLFLYLSTTQASYKPVSLRHSHSFRMLRKNLLHKQYFLSDPDGDSFKKMIFSILNIEKVSESFIGLRFSGQLCEDKNRSSAVSQSLWVYFLHVARSKRFNDMFVPLLKPAFEINA